MTKHFVLNVNPTAKYDWDRCTLRDPITANRPDLADLVAEAIGEQPGAYLVAVNIEVTVLEKTSAEAPPVVLEPTRPQLAAVERVA